MAQERCSFAIGLELRPRALVSLALSARTAAVEATLEATAAGSAVEAREWTCVRCCCAVGALVPCVHIYMYTWHESLLRISDFRCYESVLYRLKCAAVWGRGGLYTL